VVTEVGRGVVLAEGLAAAAGSAGSAADPAEAAALREGGNVAI
jgi:hypothetical protein